MEMGGQFHLDLGGQFAWIFHPDTFMRGFDIFLMVHLLLHLLYLRHKNNEFKDWISWSIIIGAGLFGLMDLIF